MRRSYSFSASPLSGPAFSLASLTRSPIPTHPPNRAASPASSISSHVSGASQPPRSKNLPRPLVFASQDILDPVDNWDDGHFSLSESIVDSSDDDESSSSEQGHKRLPGDPPTPFYLSRLTSELPPSLGKRRATSPPRDSHAIPAAPSKRTQNEPQAGIYAMYICDCCPKKPKKFDNPNDLSAHENEKPYACGHCGNRFRNKNEAQRHENSLHLRRHSWSCAAFVSFHDVFYSSEGQLSSSLGSCSPYDVCGYCGREFPNLPQPDWDQRFEHITTDHRFGECNNAKKFFREDHFHQHLKHAHQVTIGAWVNPLSNAAMKTEDPPAVCTNGKDVSPPLAPVELKTRELEDKLMGYGMYLRHH